MDAYTLTSPEGSSLNLASWIRVDPGPDFGIKDLPKAEFSENAQAEGGMLGYESAGVRHFAFPLLLASSSLFTGGLPGFAGYLRRSARPGAYIDLQVEHVAAGDAVRFDILAGRLDEDYSIPLQRSPRREALLRLDVQPYGYSPSQILLASAASIGLPGFLALPASVIGDVPGWAEIVIQPTTATNYPAGSWVSDFLAFGLGGRASMVAHWPAASLASVFAASLAGDIFVPGAQSIAVPLSPTQGGWTTMALATISEALEPAYRGRYRAFAWAHLSPSQTPWLVSLDAAAHRQNALASYQPVATLVAAVASGAPGAYAQPSPAHQLLDLGDIFLPPAASGLPQTTLLRFWAAPPTSGDVGLASPMIKLGGLYLLPVDRSAGVLPRGLAQPSIGMPSGVSPTVARFAIDAQKRRAVFPFIGNNLATTVPMRDGLTHYRGGFPFVGPSSVRLDLIGGSRRWSLSTPPAVGSYPQIVGSDNPKAYYRTEEAAGPTMIDSMGSWHGSWVNAPSLGHAGAVGSAGRFDGSNDYGRIPSILGPWATSWSIEMWAQREGANSIHDLITQGPDGATGIRLALEYYSSNKLSFSFYADALYSADSYSNEGTYHHLFFTWSYANRTRAIWRDGALVASGVANSTYQASGPLDIGRSNSNSLFFPGPIDEMAFYIGTAVGTDIVQRHYYAVASQTTSPSSTNPPTGPLIRSAPQFAAVSVRYTPRFTFLKGV